MIYEILRCIYKDTLVHICNHDWRTTECGCIQDKRDLFFKCRGFFLYSLPEDKGTLIDMIESRLCQFQKQKYVVLGGQYFFSVNKPLVYSLCPDCFKKYYKES